MDESFIVKNACKLCDSKDLELVLELAPTPSGDAYVPENKLSEKQELYPLDLLLCKDCSFVQLRHVVNPNILYSNYSYTTSISLGLVEYYQKYVDDVLNKINPARNSLVIDVGSNDGTLLRHFKEKGIRVLGIDPAETIANKATESGIETLAEFFSAETADKIKTKHGKADIITTNMTFANVDDLTDFTLGIKNLLSQNGIFVFETGYLVDLIRNNLFDNIYHEHLSYFSVKSLERFFKKNDLELIDIDTSASKGGSIRGIVQSKNGSRTRSSRIQEFISLETELKIDCPEIYQNLSSKLTDTQKKLLDVLNDIKKSDKTIAGYGASVGVTTFIYHFNLAGLLSFLADDNSMRHGLYSPGHHIPVLSSQKIYEKKPNYIIIFAWRYASPIIKKHQKYIDNGGHFIVPWPEIKIY